ncbi:hypothetical protein RJ639_005399 [Escallonia herrerae]|uniref:Cation/H+ exchanger domain-containing protein n=1 Tax=Escallonia herrerae TaxID=1293975 RepID=A0AA88VVH2_9ASTE|nr:hypothetical protein RJ639_005399 [Escallonia herrerae]
MATLNKGELPGQNEEVCRVDVHLHSTGLWSASEARNFLSYALPRLQLQLALIFLLTQCLHFLFRRLYMPRLISEVMAGVILGKTFLGAIPHFSDTLFPEEAEIFIDLLSKIGFMFFMFLAGVKMDPSMVTKTGAKAWTLGISAMLVPVSVGLMVSNMTEDMLPLYRRPAISSAISTLYLIPFPVIATLLLDLKIMNTELGRLALAATLVGDLLSTAASFLVGNVRLKFLGWQSSMVAQIFVLSLALIAIIIFCTRVASLWIIKRTPEGKSVKGIYIALIACAVLASAILSDNVGLQYQFGPFLLGLSVPDGPPLGSTLVERLDTFISGIFAPLLMAYCGLELNLFEVFDVGYLRTLWSVISIEILTKFAAVFVPAVLCRMPIRDAVALSFIMMAQGIVEIALYHNNFKNQTIDSDTFTALVESVLAIATISYVVVRLVHDYSRRYTGYQKRNILHTAYNAELRVLACAHRQDDALAAIKLLETSNPARESPIAVYALNLVELVGRATPLLINHRLGQKVASSGSRSQQMIEVFQSFEQQYSGLVSVQVFTAMSLQKFMYHDICSLAFDKLASIIVLPFHRKWNQNGKIVFDNNALRNVNRQVLETAPCSVAVLVDRRKINHEPSAMQSPYHVGVLFLGGDDDREALAYGKRMAKSSGVHLTVVRLVAVDDRSENQWDTVLDTETLKDIKVLSSHQNNVAYREEKVKDGPEAALIANAMEEAFDLIMVGRRHRDDSPLLSGISQWSDLAELGPLGDILASSDVKKPVSVLVVQQQVVKSK